MELVLPNNYVEIEEEEMMYLDGGTAKNFANNIYGLLKKSAERQACGIPSWSKIVAMSYGTAASYFGLPVLKMSMITGNLLITALVGAGALIAITYLWNKRVFY